jgi:hypothetical protein
MPELFLLFLPDSKTGRKTVVLNAPAMAILAELPRIGAFAIAGESGGDAEEKQRADLKRPWVAVRRHAIHPAREQQLDIERVLAYRRASPVLPFAFCYFLSYVFRTINGPLADELVRHFSLRDGSLGIITRPTFLPSRCPPSRSVWRWTHSALASCKVG